MELLAGVSRTLGEKSGERGQGPSPRSHGSVGAPSLEEGSGELPASPVECELRWLCDCVCKAL